MILLCTGSRNWKDYELVEKIILRLMPTLVIHGGAHGLDTVVENICNAYDIEQKIFYADWSKGLSAGPKRNAEMVAYGPDACLAFHEDPLLGKGTKDCVERCEKAGIPVRKIIRKLKDI